MSRWVIYINLLLMVCAGTSQEKPKKALEGLINLNYDELRENFEKPILDSVSAINHVRAYLEKAKRENNHEQQAYGYWYLSKLLPYEKGLTYADSLIQHTKSYKNHPKFPMVAYNAKGNLLSQLGNRKEALSFFLIALEHANEENIHKAAVQYNIGVLHYYMGNWEEAKRMFTNYKGFLLDQDIEQKEKYLLVVDQALADLLIMDNKLDSAETIVRDAMKIINKRNQKRYYNYYLITSAALRQKQNNNKAAIDSLSKARKFFAGNHDPLTLSVINSNLSVLLLKSGETNRAISLFDQANTYAQESKNFVEENLKSYPVFIEYFKQRKEFEQQIKYMNAYLRLDSIYTQEFKFFSKTLTENYTIPTVLNERKIVLQQVQKSNRIFKYSIYMLVALVAIATFYALFLYQRNKVLKKRFISVVNNPNTYFSNDGSRESNNRDNRLKIDQNLVKQILSALEIFEKEMGFLDKKCTQNELAKLIKTNSTYLSKVINVHKGMNFSNYLNSLRIQYIIQKLKEDSKIQNYTIEAIAEEAGFNNAQSFSNAFYKITKLYPSFFIKQLKNSSLNEKKEHEIYKFN